MFNFIMAEIIWFPKRHSDEVVYVSARECLDRLLKPALIASTKDKQQEAPRNHKHSPRLIRGTWNSHSKNPDGNPEPKDHWGKSMIFRDSMVDVAGLVFLFQNCCQSLEFYNEYSFQSHSVIYNVSISCETALR